MRKSSEVLLADGQRQQETELRDDTNSRYRSTQRCAAIFPLGGMKHSQDVPIHIGTRRSVRPPDGGREDLLGEVMRKKRHCPDPSGSKQNLSRLAGSGGSVLRIGMRYAASHDRSWGSSVDGPMHREPARSGSRDARLRAGGPPAKCAGKPLRTCMPKAEAWGKGGLVQV